MKIPIALITDERFAPYCATTIASVLNNSQEETEFDFYILTGGLSQTVKEKFNGLKAIKDCSINIISIDIDNFKGLPKCNHIPIESYFRFKLFSLLDGLDKVIYLDSDMIVLGDIEGLFNTNIDNYYAGMVIDTVKEVGTVLNEVKQKLQFPVNSDYFNAGVMVINLNKCREDHIESKLFDWAKRNYDKLTWADQDVINVIMHGLIKKLPSKYNIQLTAYKPNAEKEIIHYCGPDKPWNNKGMPLSEYFWNNFYPFMTIYQ